MKVGDLVYVTGMNGFEGQGMVTRIPDPQRVYEKDNDYPTELFTVEVLIKGRLRVYRIDDVKVISESR